MALERSFWGSINFAQSVCLSVCLHAYNNLRTDEWVLWHLILRGDRRIVLSCSMTVLVLLQRNLLTAAVSSEMSVHYYQNARRHIPVYKQNCIPFTRHEGML
jgi:hypothetical protein